MKIPFFSCQHSGKLYILDFYPETEWLDAGSDSGINFCRGSVKAKCMKCKNIHLRKREFIGRDKITSQVFSMSV